MTSIIAVAFMVLLGAATGAIAQARPDFSGEWMMEPRPVTPAGSAPAVQGDMGSGWGPALTIRQDDKQLIIEDRIFSRYDLQPPVRLAYPLDGSEALNTVMLGHSTQKRTSRASWNGRTLEITTRSGQPLTTEVVQRLQLESPDVLVIEVSRSTAGVPPSSTRATYRKQP
jgi:hypothetical protein